jgi:DNA-binding GntR family transcriptional regulator
VRNTVKDAERAYESLKSRIIRLELAPGAVLHEADLQKKLSVGRTPLREAIQRLALDRLVVVLPRRGTFVADISIGDLRHLWEVRLPLEGHCARLAAERMSPREVAALQALLRRAEEVAGTGDFHAIGEADRLLHEALAAATGNPYLTDTVHRLYALTQRIWHYTQSRAADKDALMHIEWRAVVDAIRNRDPESAERSMREHVTQGRTSLLGSI